ncbi:MAG: copper amine oxidase N-terminal domain-containing protein [Tissierellia bacterium]|nr:copper amine oxidase N-terminal domain-containing protein [Tissierellia bacterium]
MKRKVCIILGALMIFGIIFSPLSVFAKGNVNHYKNGDFDILENPNANFDNPIVKNNYLQNLHKAAPERMIKIWLKDYFVLSDVYPFIRNERTYVPIRFIAEALGYKVIWYGEIRQVDIEAMGKTITLKIDESDSEKLPAVIRNDRTFVPLRFIAEEFGEIVDYYAPTKVVTIGNGFDENSFYKVKYFDKDLIFETRFKVNFAKKAIENADDNSFANDNEFYKIVSKNIDEYIKEYTNSKPSEEKPNVEKPDKKVEDKKDATAKPNDDLKLEDKPRESVYTHTKVEEENRLYDKYYIEPNEEDALVGSWYGRTKTKDTDDYYDEYWYIEKLDGDKYHVTQRSVKPDGSELITLSYARYFPEWNMFKTQKSYKTAVATGYFDFDWYSNTSNFILKSFDYMYLQDDEKVFMQKY